MVTLDEAVLVEADCKTAVTITVGGLGIELGAVNRPEALIVPTVGFPPGIAFTCQVTAELPAFCTAAVNCTVVPAKGCAEAGDTVTITGVGALEDTSPPQEIKNIVSSGKNRKRNDGADRCTPGSIASRDS